MDVNRTRFHLLLGSGDWLRDGAPPTGAEWSERHQAVGLAAKPFVFPERRVERVMIGGEIVWEESAR